MNTYVIMTNRNIGALWFNYYIKASTKTRVIEWANAHICGDYTVYELTDYNNLLKDIEDKAIEI